MIMMCTQNVHTCADLNITNNKERGDNTRQGLELELGSDGQNRAGEKIVKYGDRKHRKGERKTWNEMI